MSRAYTEPPEVSSPWLGDKWYKFLALVTTDNNEFTMDFTEWNHCLFSIGLDCTLPLYEMLGLKLTNANKFHSLLKNRIDDNLLEEPDFRLHESILEDIRRDFAEEFPAVDYQNFYYYSTTIYYGVDGDKRWGNWRLALQRLFKIMSDEPGKIDTSAFPPQILETLRDGYLLCQPAKSKLWTLLESYYNKPVFSEWDQRLISLSIYGRHAPLTDLFWELEIIMDINFFQLFWQQHIIPLRYELKEELRRIATDMLLLKPDPDIPVEANFELLTLVPVNELRRLVTD